MSSTSLIELIKVKWEEERREKEANGFAGDIFTETTRTQEARALEQLLTDRFEAPMENYQEGLISASDFLTQLLYVASQPVGEGE